MIGLAGHRSVDVANVPLYITSIIRERLEI
jgi:hypothetical protein